MEVGRFYQGHIYSGFLDRRRVIAKSVKDEVDKCQTANLFNSEHQGCHDPQFYRNLRKEGKGKVPASVLRHFELCPSKRIYSDLTALDFYQLFFDYSLFLNLRAKIMGTEDIFPKIEAVCPQVVVYENSGKSLDNFVKSDLISRYRISYEAIKLAHSMSSTVNGFILYMTDTSLDNFVWTNDGRVILIDLDDIHVVDVAEIDASLSSKVYTHKHENCFGDCVSYAPSKLCKYPWGDMNYYLICKNVVNKLLLSDADEDLLDILEKCVSDGFEKRREEHAMQLKEALLYRLTHTGIPMQLNFVTFEVGDY